MRTHRIVTLVMAVAACSDQATSSGTPPPAPPPPPPSSAPVLIQGMDMSGGPEQVVISQAGYTVSNASVTVNGVALTSIGGGTYVGNVLPSVPLGGQLTLAVTAGTETVSAVGTVPAMAAIVNISPVNRGTPITVSWASSTSPDSFYVGLNYINSGVIYSTDIRTSGLSRDAQLPTSDVPAGSTDFSISVFGFNIGTFTGNVAAGSNMRLRTLGVDKPYTFGIP